MSNKLTDDKPAVKAAKVPRPAVAQPARPRLRVLAGPNGSGKSTIKSDLKPHWIGVFVNADEMERDLKATSGYLSLDNLGISGEILEVLKRIKQSLKTSGLESRLDLPALLADIKIDKTMTLWVPGLLAPIPE